MKPALIAALFAVVLSACSFPAQNESDRLVILHEGDVITLAADGSDAQTIAAASDGSFFQPIWSPDGSLIAFSESADTAAIHVAEVDGDSVYSKETGTFPFYFSWSSRNELAILHNDVVGLRLDTTSLGPDGLTDLRLVESGQPLYYSWNPEGNEFAAHTGTDRLVRNNLTESVSIADSPGAFPAPAWTDSGILTLLAGGPNQTLALINGEEVVTLAQVRGPAAFIPNHDASLVAVQVLAPEEEARSVLLQTTPTLPSNRLVVLDTQTGEVVTAAQRPVLAFFWSPVDDQLLILDIVDGPAARWSVWSEEGLKEQSRFTPDVRFLGEFVPFFDQYAQSVALWSPDGSAFAFPGAIGDEAGVWVQSVDGDPNLIHEGTWVSWAP